MSKKETDILQIKKYLNGELDAKAMHQLERRAQDDPFLMDTLEGYESAGSDQQANLDELSAWLKRRVTQKKLRIIPWMLIGIAASVLIVCSVGVWWLKRDQAPRTDQTKNPVALVVRPLAKTTPNPGAKANSATAEKPKGKSVITKIAKRPEAPTHYNTTPPPILREITITKTVANTKIADSAARDTTQLNEMIVMGYAKQKKKDVAAPVSTADTGKVKKPRDTTSEQLLQGHAAGVVVNNNAAPRQEKDIVINGKIFAGKSLNEISTSDKNYASSKKIIKGRVVANDDGLPIPGVSVKVAGTNVATQTDANGRFNLSVDSSKTTLVVGYIGYQTIKVDANNRDSLKTIALSPANSSLNEVVVTGYASQKDTEEPVVIYAHPQTGWSSFRKYLKEKAVSPDGKTGVVKLSFTVDRNGAISAIKIKKGLGLAADQKAIDLINNGPRWVGNTNGEPEKVNLKIRFAKQDSLK